MSYSNDRLQFLEDIITTAIEGGIGYWSTTVQYQWRLDVTDQLATRSVGTIRVHEGTRARIRDEHAFDWQRWEGCDYYDITPEVIERGIRKIADVHRDDAPPKVRWSYHRMIQQADRELDAGDIDADLADVIVQVALFGEVRYG